MVELYLHTPYAFMAFCLIKRRDNLTLLFRLRNRNIARTSLKGHCPAQPLDQHCHYTHSNSLNRYNKLSIMPYNIPSLLKHHEEYRDCGPRWSVLDTIQLEAVIEQHLNCGPRGFIIYTIQCEARVEQHSNCGPRGFIIYTIQSEARVEQHSNCGPRGFIIDTIQHKAELNIQTVGFIIDTIQHEAGLNIQTVGLEDSYYIDTIQHEASVQQDSNKQQVMLHWMLWKSKSKAIYKECRGVACCGYNSSRR
jgi:hypothetical protein